MKMYYIRKYTIIILHNNNIERDTIIIYSYYNNNIEKRNKYKIKYNYIQRKISMAPTPPPLGLPSPQWGRQSQYVSGPYANPSAEGLGALQPCTMTSLARWFRRQILCTVQVQCVKGKVVVWCVQFSAIHWSCILPCLTIRPYLRIPLSITVTIFLLRKAVLHTATREQIFHGPELIFLHPVLGIELNDWSFNYNLFQYCVIFANKF